MLKTGITTHVLDISSGSPAPFVALKLEKRDGDGWRSVGEAATDGDGRSAFAHAPQMGEYRLTFEVAAYFAARQVAAFYPRVQIIFSVPADGMGHYHVPLLLGPFGYSTYRGS